MPQAVTHILVPIFLVAIFRDLYFKNKSRFSLHYVFIAGLGGILPDIDIAISVFLNLIGKVQWDIHKTFTHSIFFPLLFLVLFLLTLSIHKKARLCNIGRHRLKISTIFLMIAIGVILHLILDTVTGDRSFLLYPFSAHDYGLNLVAYLPISLQALAIPALDGALLIIYMVYLELRHRISDFL